MKIYDLSTGISNKTVTYPGDPPVSLRRVVDCVENVYNVASISMGTHSGTHVDLPLHVLKDGIDAAAMPLDKFFGEAAVIEIPCTEGSSISSELLDAGSIKKGDILIIRTGWEEKAGTADFFKNFPYFDPSFADKLIELEIKALGTDLPSADGAGVKGTVHKKLLSNDIVIIEALVNLKQLAGRRCYFNAVPLKIEGGDGSPVRAYAFTSA